ncbi:MAG: hypothetical protein JW881_12430 [Spirochaetales bacterium]|nr:hypothetical protein [Spirochaetales bacterium]
MNNTVGVFIATMILGLVFSCTAPEETGDGEKGFVTDAAYTASDGLADDNVHDAYYAGGEYYAATNGGISISTDNGETWNTTTTPDIPHDQVYCILLDGGTVYAGTFAGLAVGANKGETWTTYIAGFSVKDIMIDGGVLYAATGSGLVVADTGDLSNPDLYTTDVGLADNNVNSIFLTGTTLYLGTEGGLSITNTNFTSWMTYDIDDGLLEDGVDTVVASGEVIICGVNYAVNISANNGTDWAIDYSTGGGAVTGTVIDGTKVYIAKYGGPLFITDNLGADWTGYDIPGSPLFGYNMNAVFVDSPRILICHTGGLIRGHIEE